MAYYILFSIYCIDTNICTWQINILIQTSLDLFSSDIRSQVFYAFPSWLNLSAQFFYTPVAT